MTHDIVSTKFFFKTILTDSEFQLRGLFDVPFRYPKMKILSADLEVPPAESMATPYDLHRVGSGHVCYPLNFLLCQVSRRCIHHLHSERALARRRTRE